MISTLERGIKQVGVIAALLLAVLAFNTYVPVQHNPLRPLSLDDPIGAATPFKLARLQGDFDKCYSLLDQAEIEYTALPEGSGTERCPLDRPLTLDQSLYPYSTAPLKMSCAQTASVYIWENEIVGPAAEAVLGTRVDRILTYGTFSCRNIAGSNRLSEHGRANAIDIRGFRLADGRVVDVREHWREDSELGRFLEDVHGGACNLFSVVLGPDYNAAHADHFHFDMGGASICR
jgi:hypothetical protein